MRIMLVNDDGYRAQGIRVLGRALIAAGHDVKICAPDRERSGASHSFSFGGYIAAEPFEEDGFSGYAIGGTPADSAALGLQLLDNKVDLVISGINHGTNLGGACVYSGTVGAAMEASMIGCPALAISIGDYTDRYCFEDCARVVVKALDWIKERPLERGEIYNLNVPNRPYGEIKGFKSAALTRNMRCNISYEKCVSADGKATYMTRFGGFVDSEDMGCDHMLLSDNWATLTVLTWNIAVNKEMDNPEIEL